MVFVCAEVKDWLTNTHNVNKLLSDAKMLPHLFICFPYSTLPHICLFVSDHVSVKVNSFHINFLGGKKKLDADNEYIFTHNAMG